MKYKNLKFIIFSLSLLLFSSCVSLPMRTFTPYVSNTSFWFKLDPALIAGKKLTLETPNSFNREFDPLFAKCTLLLYGLNAQIPQKLYHPLSINYEIHATLAMIDSLDPIEAFAGSNIWRAEAAFIKIQEFRDDLLSWKAKYDPIAPIQVIF